VVFIDVESGGGPVRAPCPIRRPPNPGADTTPQIILLIYYFILFLINNN